MADQNTPVIQQKAGNVGIGVGSPSYKLDVAGNGRFTSTVAATKGTFSDSSGVGAVLEAYNTVATNATTAIIRQTTAGGNGNQDIGLLVDIQGAGDSDRIANFRYYDGSSYNSRMAITRGGNVGIGTISPGYKLELGGLDTNDGILLRSPSSQPRLIFYSGGATTNNRWWDFIPETGGTLIGRVINDAGTAADTWLKVTRSGASISSVVFPSSGNVGIGTTSTPYKPTVTGDTSISGLLGVGSYIDLSGILYLRSDARILNKDGNAWLSFAARDTSGTDALMNLSNIGTLTNASTAVLANPNYVRKIYYRFFTPPTSTGNSTHDVYVGRITYGVTRITIYGDGYGAENAVCFEIARNWGIGTVPYINIRHGNLPQIVSLHHQSVAGDYASSDIFMKYTYNAPSGYANNMYMVIETEGLSGWSVAAPSTPTLDDSNKLPLALYASLGNVGIGTTSPDSILQLGSKSTSTQPFLTLARVATGGYWAGIDWNDGSTNTVKIYSDANNGLNINVKVASDLQFSTNNTERMRVTSGGSVGIGTTNPGYPLDLGTGGTGNSIRARRIYAAGTGTDSGFTLNSTLIYQSAAGNFHITDPGSYPNIILTLTTGSSVGIGVSTPNYKLDVNGTVNATDYYFNSTSTQRAAKRYVSSVNLDNSGYTVVCNVTGGELASGVKISFQGTAGNTVINVMADILVNHYQDILITSQAGIYTTLTLRVKSDNNEVFSIEATTNSPYTCTTYFEVFPLGNETVSFGGSAQTGASLTHTCRPGINISATGGSDGDFAASGYGYFGGNLGIGAYSPGNKLLISSAVGAAGFNNGISIVTSPGTYTSGHGGMLQFQNEDVITAGIRGVRESGWGSGMAFYVHNTSAGNTFGTTFVERMRINEQGNIGIGTTTPSYLLDVAGTIRATGDVIAYSDARVKDNIKTITDALTKVTSLRGVTYTRKDSDDKSEKVGVIAQEVLEVLPQVVQQDNEGQYSVAYGNMAGLFIEAIKELKAQNDTLQSRIQQLESLLLSK